MLEELESLKEKKGQLEAEVQKYRDSDPELIEVLKKEIDLSKQSANRYLLMSQAYVKSTNSKPFKITYTSGFFDFEHLTQTDFFV